MQAPLGLIRAYHGPAVARGACHHEDPSSPLLHGAQHVNHIQARCAGNGHANGVTEHLGVGRVEELPAVFGGSGALEVHYGYEALVNHDQAVDEVAATARELLGPDRILWKAKPSMGVEDFSYFLQERPGAFYNLGCGNEATGVTAPLHNSRFDIDEDCLVIGAAMQAALAMRFLDEGRQA